MRLVLAAGILGGIAAPALADHVVIPVPYDPVPYAHAPIARAVDPIDDRAGDASVRKGDDQPVGVVFTGGWAAQRGGPEGWVGRIDSEVLTVAPPDGKDG